MNVVPPLDIASFVKRHGGRKESSSPQSHEYLFTCTICRSSRLRWNAAKQTWICWGCKTTGSTIDLVCLLDRCSRIEAMQRILDGYVGGDAPTSLTPVQPIERHGAVRRLPPMEWPGGVELIADVPMHARAIEYLRGRGITLDTIREYKIGFGRSGRFENFVVFPVFMDGALVYYQGRATWDPPAGLTHAERKKWIEDTHYQKTRNPKAGEQPAASASEVLFDYDRAKGREHVVICEGPIDAIKVGLGAVALLGKVMSSTKLERLRRSHARTYTVYLDEGEEERAAARTIAAALSAYGTAFVVHPPPGYDAGALDRAQNAEILRRAVPYRSLLTGV